jgi:hypothetical protein
VIGAPSLSCGRAPAEVFRVIYMPTLSRPTFVVTVTRDNRRWLVSFVRFADRAYARTLESFEVAERGERMIPEAEAAAFRRALERADFWALPNWDHKTGEDGTMITVEARRREGYHVVTRHSPRDTPFRRAALIFFELAGLPYPEDSDLPR